MTTSILTEAERADIAERWATDELPDIDSVTDAIEAAVLAKLAAMNEPVGEVRAKASEPGTFVHWRASLPAGTKLFTHPPAAQDREDAERVINAAREAMDESFEAGNNEADISIPSHLAAALSLALDEYDAALKGTP